MNHLRKITKSAALLLLVFMADTATAVPIDYTFKIYFDGAGPAGAVPVRVTLDGVTGTDTETFRPDLDNLLAFEFNYSGQSYAMADDRAFPASPLIALQDGALTHVSYVGRKSLLGGRIGLTASIELNDQTNSTAYARVAPGLFNFSFGEIAPDTWQRISAPVAAPATFALLCLGLAGIGLRRKSQ